jgi:hypothetical protein
MHPSASPPPNSIPVYDSNCLNVRMPEYPTIRNTTSAHFVVPLALAVASCRETVRQKQVPMNISSEKTVGGTTVLQEPWQWALVDRLRREKEDHDEAHRGGQKLHRP